MLPVWLALCLLPVLGGAERFNCRGRILGAYYADAKSGCKAFHVCVRVAGGGIRDFRFFCPPGTLFHQEAQTCTDWGDDDPLACPADIYDGQFDLYKIGSGFDTKKLSSPGNREEESEYGLQRAETGDRRLSQNSGASDLRAAHSSDFFSGQRDRGRDDPAPASTPQRTPQNQQQHHAPQQQQSPQQQQQLNNQQQTFQQPAPQTHAARQSFRRPTTPRAPVSSSQYTNPPPPPPPQPSSVAPQYDNSKRKFVRKRPVYVSQSTPAPQTTFAQNTQFPQSFPEQAPQHQQQHQKQKQHHPQQQQHQHQQHQQQQHQQQQQQQHLQQQHQQPQQNQQQQQYQQQQQHQQQKQQHQQQQQQLKLQSQQQNFNRRVPQAKPTIPPVSVPPQYKDYKDEYVEVSRVTPKPNKYFQSKSPAPFSQSTPAPNFNKNNNDGLVELYNYDSQSTPGLNAQSTQNDNRPFKVQNSFSVSETLREPDFARTNKINPNRGTPTTVDYNPSRGTTSTPAFKNFNSVSYEPEKNNFVTFSKQQNYYSNPTTTPATTAYTTTYRPEPPLNLNTVAYNTNIGFGHTQESNYAESDEDDGQYRPPQGEDDGQYRPELYERELLSGAHSLNIAASGNRLPEDQKNRGKTKAPFKTTPQNTQTTYKASQAPPKPSSSQTPYKPVSQTAAPRPFRPAPTPTLPPTQRAPETYPTTIRPQTQPQTQRTFDYYQTYTTTSRPSESSAAPASYNLDSSSNYGGRPTTTLLPKSPVPRPRAPAPPTVPTAPPAPPRPTTRPPFFANPASNKEDNSYDYAYYDSDPGFSEYDHIEEFGKTKTKKA